MSGVATIAKPRAGAISIRLEADIAALAVVGIVVAVLTALVWGTWGDLGRDTGYDFVAATRVAHGQLPYVDYVYYYGPLAPFMLGLAALIGGTSVTTFVLIGLLLTYAIVAATYALARTQAGPVGAAIAAVTVAAIAFSPTNLSYVVPHTYSATFAILLTLMFLLGLARASNGRPRAVLGAGVAAGLVALTRPEFEAAVVVAALVWLVARARAGRSVRGDTIALIVPALAVPVLVYGAFLTAISPHRLLLENLYPVATLRAGGSAIIREQAPLTTHSLALVLAYFAAYAVGAAALVLASRGLSRYRPAVAAAAVAAAALAVLTLAASNPEAARSRLEWVYGGVPFAVVAALVVLLVRHVVQRRTLDSRDETLLTVLAVLAVLAAKELQRVLLSGRPRPAGCLCRPVRPRGHDAASLRRTLSKPDRARDRDLLARPPRARLPRTDDQGRARPAGRGDRPGRNAHGLLFRGAALPRGYRRDRRIDTTG